MTRTYVADEAGTITRFCDPDCTGTNPQYLVAWNGHGDALSVSRLDLTTGVATPPNRYSYLTWGTPVTATANGYGDLGFRYLYVGAQDVQWDNQLSAGLLYMHARTYHPALGRFLQPDPARAEGNLYAYTANSPVTRSDSSGLDPYFGHTRAELEFCNPVNVWNADACAKNLAIGVLVSREAERRFAPARSGRQDAVRHCMWQGCLAVAVGPRMAKKFGDLHEDYPTNPWRERFMDQWNNLIGRILSIGISYDRGYGIKVRDRCLRALNSGALIRYAN